MDYDNIKISMKAFDVPTMVEANRRLAAVLDNRGTPYPLHLGVTEAGTPRAGSVRSAIGIGMLLAEGIGDTIRVSLAAHPKEEIPVCWDILSSLGLRRHGPTLVACPTCGRIEIELIPLAQKVEEHFVKLGKPITVAVMGCVVNGQARPRWPTSASPVARAAGHLPQGRSSALSTARVPHGAYRRGQPYDRGNGWPGGRALRGDDA
jgi:(E)-4-hydroxy-3-methylbut-2-enyl-diphosphate synthase